MTKIIETRKDKAIELYTKDSASNLVKRVGEFAADGSGLILGTAGIQGNSGNTTDNAKLHRGDVNVLEVVTSNDTTADGVLSPSKASLNVKEASIGSSSTPSDNVKLHKGAPGVLEVVTGDDTTLDNTLSSNKMSLNVKDASIGASSTPANNVKLHKGATGILEVVTGDDSTLDNNLSANKASLNAKDITIGGSTTPADNAKIHRGSGGVLQFLKGDDSTADGVSAPATSKLPISGILNYDIVIGTAAQVTQGLANFSSFASAGVLVDGYRILVIGQTTDVSDFTLTNKVYIEGIGYDSKISCNFILGVGSSKSLIKYVNFVNNLTFNNGANANIVTDCWMASGKVVTDNNGNPSGASPNNLILILQEE